MPAPPPSIRLEKFKSRRGASGCEANCNESRRGAERAGLGWLGGGVEGEGEEDAEEERCFQCISMPGR